MALTISSARPSFGLHPYHSRAAAQLRALARDLLDLEAQAAASAGIGLLDLRILQLLTTSRDLTRAELAVATGRPPAEVDQHLGALRCRPGNPRSPGARRWRRGDAALVAWRPFGATAAPGQREEPMEPWITPRGRRKVDEVAATLDAALLPVLRQLRPAELERVTTLAMGLREASWEAGTSPIVAVIEPVS